MYLFAWETPVDGGKWKAPHSIEHAMVFDNVAKSASMVGSGSDQQKVADAVSSAWIRFAKTGDPKEKDYAKSRRQTKSCWVKQRLPKSGRRYLRGTYT